MTCRELYEYALIECNKLEAPSLLLEDYNYFINKAVQQYINLIYNRYDMNQQSTDDLRVLKTSTVIELTAANLNPGQTGLSGQTDLYGKSYIGELPGDYLHMLNCIVEFLPKKNFKCYESGDPVQFAARRLTSDVFGGILNNAYMRPMYKRPYYFINNWNLQNPSLPTNATLDEQISKDASSLANTPYSTVDATKPSQGRNANISKVLLEIRFGKDDNLFMPTKAYIDYLKAPQYIRLTQKQIDTTEDTSQVLEFPDYVCFEIVNIFTKLLMENSSDPRLQTNIPINQTIPSGGGAPQQSAQQQGQ